MCFPCFLQAADVVLVIWTQCWLSMLRTDGTLELLMHLLWYSRTNANTKAQEGKDPVYVQYMYVCQHKLPEKLVFFLFNAH